MARLNHNRHPAYKIGWWIGRTIIAFIVGSFLWVVAYKYIAPPTTLTMLNDPRGATRSWLSLDKMDPSMARAAIAAEDARFCTHGGFDRAAIDAAIKANSNGKRLRGGSTISQQTAKNAFLWQGNGLASRILRKIPEAWFTMLIEQIWGKRRIMEVYLNIAETGLGTYGVNAGAQRYFGHDATRLTATEAARIAAVLPNPKKRAAIAPTGQTRRYGNNIARRSGVVRRDALDGCLAK